jgi:hypothetical protein
MTNHEKFWGAFRVALAVNIQRKPEDYMPGSKPDEIADKMQSAADAKGIRGININSISFTHACKAVGIPRTYKAIEAYLKEGLS